MDNVALKFFPDSHQESLALIWLQQQDLNGKSPTEISDMYYTALREICDNYNKNYAPNQTPPRKPRVLSPGI